jgi:hypothetical protein
MTLLDCFGYPVWEQMAKGVFWRSAVDWSSNEGVVLD